MFDSRQKRASGNDVVLRHGVIPPSPDSIGIFQVIPTTMFREVILSAHACKGVIPNVSQSPILTLTRILSAFKWSECGLGLSKFVPALCLKVLLNYLDKVHLKVKMLHCLTPFKSSINMNENTFSHKN